MSANFKEFNSMADVTKLAGVNYTKFWRSVCEGHIPGPSHIKYGHRKLYYRAEEMPTMIELAKMTAVE